VEEVDAAVSFYIEHLGNDSVMQSGSAFAMIAKEDLTLWITGPKALASRPMPDGNVPEPEGWNRFMFEVDDIEAVVASMKQAGVNLWNDIVSGVGGKQILAEDLPATRSNCSRQRNSSVHLQRK